MMASGLSPVALTEPTTASVPVSKVVTVEDRPLLVKPR